MSKPYRSRASHKPPKAVFNDLSAYTYIPFEHVLDHSSIVFNNIPDEADLRWYAANHKRFAYKSVEHAKQTISALGWFYKAFSWAEYTYEGEYKFRLNFDFYSDSETEKVIEHTHELFTQLDKLFPWQNDILYKEWSAFKRSNHSNPRGKEFLSTCFGMFWQFPELEFINNSLS